MAKDEKGLQPIAEILSAMSDRATRGATLQRVDGEPSAHEPIQEHRETGKPPLRTSRRRP